MKTMILTTFVDLRLKNLDGLRCFTSWFLLLFTDGFVVWSLIPPPARAGLSISGADGSSRRSC